MYETALREWHVTPHYINRHWTEELLALMFRKRNAHIRRLATLSGKTKEGVMSNRDFFEKHSHIKIKKVMARGADHG